MDGQLSPGAHQSCRARAGRARGARAAGRSAAKGGAPVRKPWETMGNCGFHGIYSWYMLAKLVHISPISRVYWGCIELVDGDDKPTNTTGGHHLVWNTPFGELEISLVIFVPSMSRNGRCRGKVWRMMIIPFSQITQLLGYESWWSTKLPGLMLGMTTF